jgi:hypothetical protein
VPVEVLFIFLLFVIVAIVIRLAAGGLDHQRVRKYVESRGGKVIKADWAPFGPGWFGEKGDRIYAVRYLDRDRNVHQAHCKTSVWSGVYFTDDSIVRYADRNDHHQTSLEDENRRLREELERLKRNQD